MGVARKSDYGIDNHVSRVVRPQANNFDLDEMIAEMIAYYDRISGSWNVTAGARGLPLLDVSNITNSLRDNSYDSRYSEFFRRSDDDGVLHEEQIQTCLDAIDMCLRRPNDCGLVVGDLQAGKTGVALGLQWLGPVNYLLTGQKIRPIYLITPQTNHQRQTENELERFLAWHGNIRLQFNDRSTSLIDYMKILNPTLHPMHAEAKGFVRNMTLDRYRSEVLGVQHFGHGDTLVDYIRRRVPGKEISAIVQFCRDARAHNSEPLFLVDEAQFGAGDRDEQKSVTRQILEQTAIDANDKLWQVRMSLGPSYRGFKLDMTDRSAAALKAWDTRREKARFAKRSIAAKKAHETRRRLKAEAEEAARQAAAEAQARADRLSAAALKAWDTRRRNARTAQATA